MMGEIDPFDEKGAMAGGEIGWKTTRLIHKDKCPKCSSTNLKPRLFFRPIGTYDKGCLNCGHQWGIIRES